MRDFNEKTITDAVIQRFSGAPNPRVKEICDSLVRHMHDFVRDIRPTYEEWEYAIAAGRGQFRTDKDGKFWF
jgi:hydroxyquinol 1,2-dioxygenase